MTKSKKTNLNTYDIAIRGTGGTFTASKIPSEAAHYWAGKKHEELVRHLYRQDEYQQSSSVNFLHCFDGVEYSASIACEVGFVEIDKVTIWTVSGRQLMGVHGESLNVTAVELENQSDLDKVDGCKLFTRSPGEGNVIYRVTTVGNFDFDKLSFTKVRINKAWLINSVWYNGKRLTTEDEFEHLGELEVRINLH